MMPMMMNHGSEPWMRMLVLQVAQRKKTTAAAHAAKTQGLGHFVLAMENSLI
jgi:hypothetical protein